MVLRDHVIYHACICKLLPYMVLRETWRTTLASHWLNRLASRHVIRSQQDMVFTRGKSSLDFLATGRFFPAYTLARVELIVSGMGSVAVLPRMWRRHAIGSVIKGGIPLQVWATMDKCRYGLNKENISVYPHVSHIMRFIEIGLWGSNLIKAEIYLCAKHGDPIFRIYTFSFVCYGGIWQKWHNYAVRTFEMSVLFDCAFFVLSFFFLLIPF
jgi:hypothetical protein